MPSSASQKKFSADEHLDQVFRALSDRTRRAMLHRLSQGPAMVSEIAEPFDMTRIAASKHLRVLEEARLVKRVVDGRVHRCSLATEPLFDVQQWLNQYRTFWAGTLDSLARHVARDEPRKHK